MLSLNFLGCGAAFYPELGNTAAWFENKGHFYLLDCGGEIFCKVINVEKFKEAQKVTVILTHMHGDHVGGLSELISFLWFKRGIRVSVVYPDKRLDEYLKLTGIMKENYSRIEKLEGQDGIWAEPVPVIHDLSMGCYGYLIQDNKEKIYYSGDSQLVSENIIDCLRKGEFSRLYLDTAKYASKESGHGNYEAMKERIETGLRHRVMCMHLDCDFRTELKKDGFSVPDI